MENKNLLKVVCVKWGTKYSVDYVLRLRNMITRNLSVPHDFVCFTEDREGLSGVKCFDFPDNFQGWWNKISLFRGDIFNKETQILFFDLDLVIVRSINFLLEGDDEFHICTSFSKPNYYNSSVMRFRAGAYEEVYSKFVDSKNASRVAKLHGDQDWIRICIRGARTWPKNKILSYKQDLIPYSTSKGINEYVVLPDDAAVIAFHGKPDPHDLLDLQSRRFRPAPFVLEHWK